MEVWGWGEKRKKRGRERKHTKEGRSSRSRAQTAKTTPFPPPATRGHNSRKWGQSTNKVSSSRGGDTIGSSAPF